MRLGKVQIVFEYVVDLDNEEMVQHAKDAIYEDVQSEIYIDIINNDMPECEFLEESDIPDFLKDEVED